MIEPIDTELPTRPGVYERLRDWFLWARLWEPARVRAIWVAVAALLLLFGVSIPADMPPELFNLLVVLAVLLPVGQGELTRKAVVPVQSAIAQVEAAQNALPPEFDLNQLEPDDGTERGDEA